MTEKVQPTKRVVVELVEGQWRAEIALAEGETPVSHRDLSRIQRATALAVRKHIREFLLAQRLAAGAAGEAK